MKKFLIFTLCVMFMGCMVSAAQALEEAVRVVSCAGDVKVTPSGETKAVVCRSGMPLEEGARIVTGRGASAEIAFDRQKHNILKIKENSEVVMKLEGVDKIELVDGEILAALRDLKKGEMFRVKTPCATCGARGTGWSTKTDKRATNVAVFEGRVFVRGIERDGSAMDKEHWVEKGFERKIKRFERPGKMEKITEARLSRMEKEVRRPLKLKKEVEKKEAKLGEKREGITEKREKITEKRAKISERKEKVADRAQKTIEKHERIEKRIEKTDEMKEQRKESVLERKDDKRVDESAGTRADTP